MQRVRNPDRGLRHSAGQATTDRNARYTMADEKNKVTDKAGEIAKNIWLAGVGAYGRAVDEAQDRMEKAGVEPPKLFRDLVKAGAALEEEARGAIEAGNAARSTVEERIQRVRDNFNLQRPVRGEDLLALHEKIDRLTNRMDALVDALNAGAATKSPRKKTGARKTTRAKAARKKTPASTAKSTGSASTARTAARKAPARKTGSRRRSN
jgi:hypothetical protein